MCVWVQLKMNLNKHLVIILFLLYFHGITMIFPALGNL